MSTDPLRELYAKLDGVDILGGCDHCDAYQTLEPVQDKIWKVTVHHDADCPRLAAYEGRTPE
jgi:hypothetical protein